MPNHESFDPVPVARKRRVELLTAVVMDHLGKGWTVTCREPGGLDVTLIRMRRHLPGWRVRRLSIDEYGVVATERVRA